MFLRPMRPVPKWFGRTKKRAVTFRAWSLPCSSSKACCRSFSSILLKDTPVEDRQLTALDRVDALQMHTSPVTFKPFENLRKKLGPLRCLLGVCVQLLGLLALQGCQVLLQGLQEAAGGLEQARQGNRGIDSHLQKFLLCGKVSSPHTHAVSWSHRKVTECIRLQE